MSQRDSDNPWPWPEQPPPVVPEMYAPPDPLRLPLQTGGSGKAVASLVLGIVGLGWWLFPCFMGLPIPVIGLVLGILGRKGPGRKKAIVGMILCIISMAVTTWVVCGLILSGAIW